MQVKRIPPMNKRMGIVEEFFWVRPAAGGRIPEPGLERKGVGR